ncbi:MAG: hypothetical protein R3240_11900 [Gammaproteobacteria bacterium]|nr:hypothetical protein [Gammaproteobacteria bacterium]
MKTVKFLKRYKIYNPGEIAGFDDKEFNRIVSGGFGLPSDQADKVIEEKEKAEEEASKNPLEEILALNAKKISGAISETSESGYVITDNQLQEMIKLESDNKNRSQAKKVIQDEIIRRLEEKTKSEETSGEGNQETSN